MTCSKETFCDHPIEIVRLEHLIQVIGSDKQTVLAEAKRQLETQRDPRWYPTRFEQNYGGLWLVSLNRPCAIPGAMPADHKHPPRISLT